VADDVDAAVLAVEVAVGGASLDCAWSNPLVEQLRASDGALLGARKPRGYLLRGLTRGPFVTRDARARSRVTFGLAIGLFVTRG
jgi:hypothetical protein